MTAPRSDDSGNIDVVVRCWVPEQPDAVVFGRLTRTGGRTELELFESLAVSDDWNEQPEPVSLCIERTDRGEPATAKYAVLTELMCTAWGTLREVYLVGVLLWGYGTLELARELPTSFDLVRVASTQLEQWLKPGILRDRFRNLPAAGGTVTVGPDRAELASRVIGDRTLSLGAKLVGGPSDSRYHISQIAYLDCTSPTGLELEDVKQFVGHVRHWLCLMTGWRAGMVEAVWMRQQLVSLVYESLVLDDVYR